MSRFVCHCGELVLAVNDGKPGEYLSECLKCHQETQEYLRQKNKSIERLQKKKKP